MKVVTKNEVMTVDCTHRLAVEARSLRFVLTLPLLAVHLLQPLSYVQLQPPPKWSTVQTQARRHVWRPP